MLHPRVLLCDEAVCSLSPGGSFVAPMSSCWSLKQKLSEIDWICRAFVSVLMSLLCCRTEQGEVASSWQTNTFHGLAELWESSKRSRSDPDVSAVGVGAALPGVSEKWNYTGSNSARMKGFSLISEGKFCCWVFTTLQKFSPNVLRKNKKLPDFSLY